MLCYFPLGIFLILAQYSKALKGRSAFGNGKLFSFAKDCSVLQPILGWPITGHLHRQKLLTKIRHGYESLLSKRRGHSNDTKHQELRTGFLFCLF